LLREFCIYIKKLSSDRILDPTAAAKSVGIGDWRPGARMTALGRRGSSREAAAATLGVLEEEENVREAGSHGRWPLRPGKNICLACSI